MVKRIEKHWEDCSFNAVETSEPDSCRYRRRVPEVCGALSPRDHGGGPLFRLGLVMR